MDQFNANIAPMLALVVLIGCRPNVNGDSEVDTAMRLYDQHKFSEAIPHLEGALDKPLRRYTRSDVFTFIGNCYCELEQFEESLGYHDRAIESDPNNYKAYVNKGVACRLMGDYDKAAELYTKALVLAPNYAELHASMGALAIYRDNYEAAVSHLERAVELDDNLAVSHSNLALAYATLGKFDEAGEQLKKAVIRGYDKPDVIKERIDQLRKSFDNKE